MSTISARALKAKVTEKLFYCPKILLVISQMILIEKQSLY